MGKMPFEIKRSKQELEANMDLNPSVHQTQESFVPVIAPFQKAMEKVHQTVVKIGNRNLSLHVFQAIQDQNEKASTCDELPDCDSLSKQLDLPREYIEKCAFVFSGKHEIDIDVSVVGMPLLYFVQTSETQVMAKQVYVGPQFRGGDSLKETIEKVNIYNAGVLSKFSSLRTLLTEEEQVNLLKESLDENKLLSVDFEKKFVELFSYSKDGVAIANKQFIYHSFVRPVFSTLIQKGTLLYYKVLQQGVQIQAIYWKNENEIMSWYKILLQVFQKEVSTSIETVDSNNPPTVANHIRYLNFLSFNDRQRKIAEELYMICAFLPRISILGKNFNLRPEQDDVEKGIETEELVDVQNIENILIKSVRIMDGNKLNIDSKQKRALQFSQNVLIANYPMKNEVIDFYLHKNRVNNAVENAYTDMSKYNDYTQIKVLSFMKIDDLLDRKQIQVFRETEEKLFLKELPWHIKLLRSLFNRKKLRPQEHKELKLKQRYANEEKIERLNLKENANEKGGVQKRKLKAQKKKQKEVLNIVRNFCPTEVAQVENEVLSEDDQKITSEILNIIDRAWEKKEYPNRIYLLEKSTSIKIENDLIFFMKKNCSKKVLSFQITANSPEFIWPIFITCRFLNKNGKRMLKDTQKAIENEKVARVSDQKKYDILSSLEMFLSRKLH